MLLAYTTNLGLEATLCLIPHDESDFVSPVPIDALVPSSAAVFYVGPKEAVIVYDEDGTKIVKPVMPAILYLTPDTTSRPGVQVARVKISQTANNGYEIFFSKEKESDWLPWCPVSEERM